MALQGTLDTFALPDVLRLLAATKKTGRLRITGARGTGNVWASKGEIVGVEAIHAPHATDFVDGLFELLRFEEGAFTFDAESSPDQPSEPTDLEVLLARAETLLEEWRGIEAVVSSMDAWVTLCGTLPVSEVVIDQDRWTTIVAVGAGATVRRIGDELCLAELPISRAIKELAEAGLVDIAATPPAGAAASMATTSAPLAPLRAPLAPKPNEPEEQPLTAPDAARARRAKAVAASSPASETFVPLDLPGHAAPAPSYDDRPGAKAFDDLSASFPGLATNGTSVATAEDEELAKQLATLSPRAASAIRAAAEATTDEEREAALDSVEGDDEPLNRGLLLKFLSSVKS